MENRALEEQVRVASPDEMKYLIKEAETQGFNRQIKDEVVPDLEGYSLIIPVMIHEHKAGVVATPHWRCRVLLRFKNDPVTPKEAWLDIDLTQFNQLHTIKQVQEAKNQEPLKNT